MCFFFLSAPSHFVISKGHFILWFHYIYIFVIIPTCYGRWRWFIRFNIKPQRFVFSTESACFRRGPLGGAGCSRPGPPRTSQWKRLVDCPQKIKINHHNNNSIRFTLGTNDNFETNLISICFDLATQAKAEGLAGGNLNLTCLYLSIYLLKKNM